MSFLLDTNVISEPVSKQPNQAVLDWIGEQEPTALYLSVATVAEIGAGIARLRASRQRSGLEHWRAQLIESFEERVLPIDLRVAVNWGDIRARAAGAGASIGPMDAFLAATAEVHGFTLVTRNVKDFKIWGGRILNPWTIV